ncbi:MAG: alanine racemase, partial [Lachnospiraceae bacterium]|nr:alanine racemase [Lachnospiraceae bacterium]
MKFHELDTPSLLLDHDIFMKNLMFMQDYADRNHVALRPHTKTHKSPDLAKIQLETGACGIAVAKTGEAEIMAAHGLTDIFIANEV